MEYEYYQSLTQPSFAPPPEIFGPVWSILYAIIAITFGIVFYRAFKGSIPRFIALPFILNLVFNAAFTPLQFGIRNMLFASIDIVLVLITLVWAMWWIYPYSRKICYWQIPYLLWVSFATVLQISITVMNAN